MNVHKSVPLRKRDLQTVFSFPLEHTPMTGFSEVISITYDFRKLFKHTHHVGKPSLRCVHHYQYSALHFLWHFQMLWQNRAKVSTLLTSHSLFSLMVFPTILEQCSIDYWYGDAVHMSRGRTTMLNSNHSSQLTSNITCTGETDVSSAEQGVKQLSVLNL